MLARRRLIDAVAPALAEALVVASVVVAALSRAFRSGLGSGVSGTPASGSETTAVGNRCRYRMTDDQFEQLRLPGVNLRGASIGAGPG